MLPQETSAMPDETNLKSYLRIKKAAQFLGVHPDTLRRWDGQGKVPSRRHPINGYRLYREGDLKLLLSKARGE